jgi:hypothetical protein
MPVTPRPTPSLYRPPSRQRPARRAA